MSSFSGFLNVGKTNEHWKEFVGYFKSVNSNLVQPETKTFEYYATHFDDVVGVPTIEGGNLAQPEEWHKFLKLDNIKTLCLVKFDLINADEDYKTIVVGNPEFIKLTNNAEMQISGRFTDSQFYYGVIENADFPYALVAYRREHKQLFFARTFPGIYFSYWSKGDDAYLVWSSDEGALLQLGRKYYHTSVMPPYSFKVLTLGKHETELDIDWFVTRWHSLDRKFRTQHNEESAVVLVSGGANSAKAAEIACQSFQNVTLLHYLYDDRNNDEEHNNVLKLYDDLGDKYPKLKMHIAFFGLRERNIHIIHHASSYCNMHDIGTIVLPGIRDNVSPDFSYEFFRAQEKAMNLSTVSRPRIMLPYTGVENG